MSQSQKETFELLKKHKAPKENNSSKSTSNTPTISRPNTPKTMNKESFVCELWKELHKNVSVIIKEDVKFEEIEKILKNKKILEICSRFWATISSLVNQKRLQKGKMKLEVRQSRILLSSLMIANFPDIVLDSNIENMDTLTKNVYDSAKNIIDNVFNVNPDDIHMDTHNDQSVNKLECEKAVKTIESFLNAFNIWQSKDVEKVVSSLSKYYEEWAKSHKVLKTSSMNDLRRTAILNTIEKNMKNAKLKMLSVLRDKNKVEKICNDILEKVEKEEIVFPHVKLDEYRKSKQQQKEKMDVDDEEELKTDINPYEQINNNYNNNNNNNNNRKPTIEEELNRRGIPTNIKTGFNLVKGTKKKEEVKVNNNNNNNNMTSDGKKIINLDTIVMEEGSKKYWIDFEKEILENKYHRLFELISELLHRLRKLTSKRQHEKLNDLLDMKFLEQTVGQGLLDAKAFYGIFNGLWEHIKSLHSPSQDKAWVKWHDDIVDQLNSPNATWHKILPKIFNKFLVKLDIIEEKIKYLQPHLKQKSQFKNFDSNNSNNPNNNQNNIPKNS